MTLHQGRSGTHRIVVLGGGYAGTLAANRCSADPDIDVTLVNPRADFVERIRLHQWIAGSGDAFGDHGRLLAPRVARRVDSAVRIRANERRVDLASGDALHYDYLVYAVGSTARVPAIPGVTDHAYPMADADDAERVRDHLRAVGQDQPVVVVGGGLTGVELAAELAERGRLVTLVSADDLVSSFGERGRRGVRSRLARIGVQVLENTTVTRVGATSMTVSGVDGTREIPSAATLLTTGFVAPALAAESGLPVDDAGRLLTDETLTCVADDHIVGAGDAVAPSGRPLRMSCQAALPLGARAADTVRALVAGVPQKRLGVVFVGQNVSLGRGDAVIQFSHLDDTPRTVTVAGAMGARIKEFVCRATVWSLRIEACHPGAYPSLRSGVGRSNVSKPSQTDLV